MSRRLTIRLPLACLAALALALAVASPAPFPHAPRAIAAPASPTATPLADFPTVDPDYIYSQLDTLATSYQHREAGYDTGLPPLVNGHDEFAAAWAAEMQRDLTGFHPTVRKDTFPIQGWRNRPAATPAVNVEVTVPGLTHPEQAVVIGCHYDGEAVSTQSANDDASGCAIELGVARALGQYWTQHHVYPARTLRFVIYDAEEQGLYGSFHYVNQTANGDLGNIVAMFNEEQSGIAYPLRYLGLASNHPLPMDIFLAPLQPNDLYPDVAAESAEQRAAIVRFRDLMSQAVPAVFRQFQALGFASLTYRDTNNNPVPLPVFAPDQTNNLRSQDDTIGSSDQLPFNLAGLPTAMFVGNATYYDPPSAQKPAWSYPYDQPQDTIQLMNTFASGSSRKAESLALALALPGMLTTWMLHQPDILGEASPDGHPLAAVSDVGAARPGQPLTLDASAAFDPSGAPLRYSWDFGDGATATGVSASHTYAAAGTYTLSLTVTSASGTRTVRKTLTVTPNPPQVTNPYVRFVSNGSPPHMGDVALPTPDDSLTLGQLPQTPGQPSHTTGHLTTSPALPIGAGLLALLLVLLGVAALAVWRLRHRPLASQPSAPTEDEVARRHRADALRSLAERQRGDNTTS